MATTTQVKFNVLTGEQFIQQFLPSQQNGPAGSTQHGDVNCAICYGDLVEERRLDEKMPLVVYHGCGDSEKMEESPAQNPIHAYHFECINQWWIQVKDCPSCRAQITNINAVYQKTVELSTQSHDGILQLVRYKMLPYLSKMQSMLETSKKLAEDSLQCMLFNLKVCAGLGVLYLSISNIDL